MVYFFARVGPAFEDVYVQNRQLWMRLNERGGTLEIAAAMANHASTWTTQLYDRRGDDVSLDEVERVVI